MGRISRVLVVAGTVAGAAAAAATAAQAANPPTGDFVNFNHCPVRMPGVNECLYANQSSGYFQLGKQKVAITNPITFQGGIIQKGDTQTYVAPKNDEALPPVSQPTSALGIAISATPVLVGQPVYSFSNFVNESGPTLTLPIKIHLQDEDGLFGDRCFIGSASDPITLNLTSGTTSPPAGYSPLKGSTGVLSYEDDSTLAVSTDNSLVDNTFAAPGASGCGKKGDANEVIDEVAGLPAAAGENEAVLDGSAEQATAPAVNAHRTRPHGAK